MKMLLLNCSKLIYKLLCNTLCEKYQRLLMSTTWCTHADINTSPLLNVLSLWPLSKQHMLSPQLIIYSLNTGSIKTRKECVYVSQVQALPSTASVSHHHSVLRALRTASCVSGPWTSLLSSWRPVGAAGVESLLPADWAFMTNSRFCLNP